MPEINLGRVRGEDGAPGTGGGGGFVHAIDFEQLNINDLSSIDFGAYPVGDLIVFLNVPDDVIGGLFP